MESQSISTLRALREYAQLRMSAENYRREHPAVNEIVTAIEHNYNWPLAVSAFHHIEQGLSGGINPLHPQPLGDDKDDSCHGNPADCHEVV
jgi:hypothetical protein